MSRLSRKIGSIDIGERSLAALCCAALSSAPHEVGPSARLPRGYIRTHPCQSTPLGASAINEQPPLSALARSLARQMDSIWKVEKGKKENKEAACQVGLVWPGQASGQAGRNGNRLE